MKKEVHPEYEEFTVVFTNGEKAKFYSTAGKRLGTLNLDTDPFNHPAWRKDGGTVVNTGNNQVNKFNKKFGSAFGA